MLNKVALLDLEQYTPTADDLRRILEQSDVLYLFNCQGQFHYVLTDLTELASSICSGEVVILETVNASRKEYEYALIVGQLLALIDAYTPVEVISAMPSSTLLLKLMQEAELSCHLTLIEASIVQEDPLPEPLGLRGKQALSRWVQPIRQHPKVEQWLGRCIYVLQQQPVKPLIQLSAWLESLRSVTSQHANSDSVAQSIQANVIEVKQASALSNIEQAQAELYKNFNQVDQVQVAVLCKLNQLQTEKPKDIYALRDFLEEMFPESDIRLLLRELLEKGHIYWNGDEIIYSHEMVLN